MWPNPTYLPTNLQLRYQPKAYQPTTYQPNNLQTLNLPLTAYQPTTL